MTEKKKDSGSSILKTEPISKKNAAAGSEDEEVIVLTNQSSSSLQSVQGNADEAPFLLLKKKDAGKKKEDEPLLLLQQKTADLTLTSSSSTDLPASSKGTGSANSLKAVGKKVVVAIDEGEDEENPSVLFSGSSDLLFEDKMPSGEGLPYSKPDKDISDDRIFSVRKRPTLETEPGSGSPPIRVEKKAASSKAPKKREAAQTLPSLSDKSLTSPELAVSDEPTWTAGELAMESSSLEDDKAPLNDLERLTSPELVVPSTGSFGHFDADQQQTTETATPLVELLTQLSTVCSRACVFLVKGPLIIGWRGSGAGDVQYQVADILFPAGAPSIFSRTLRSKQPYIGALPPTAMDRIVAGCLGTELPNRVALYPVVQNGRVTAFYYLDDAETDMFPDDLKVVESMLGAGNALSYTWEPPDLVQLLKELQE